MPEVIVRSPFPIEDAPRIWEWIAPFRNRVSDDFSPKTLTEFLVHFYGMTERGKTWAVYRDEELGGVITYEQISPIVGTAHAVFKKSFWGHKTTMPALDTAFRQMFDHCEKISSPVMEGNKAMLSLLKKLGSRFEGTLERHTTRDGKPIDLVMTAFFKDSYGRTDECRL